MLSALIRGFKIGSKPSNSNSVSHPKINISRPLFRRNCIASTSTKFIKSTFVAHTTLERRFARFSYSTASSTSTSDPASSQGFKLNEESTNTSSSAGPNTADQAPKSQPARDPWRITSGKWFSPELKRRAILEQIAERDAALPKPVHSTPPSLPWPANEKEESVLVEVREKMALMRPDQLADEIMPYWNTTSHYKDLMAPRLGQVPAPEPSGSLELSTIFTSIPRLSSPTSEQSSAQPDLETLYVMLSAEPYLPRPSSESEKKVSNEAPISDSSPATQLTLKEVRILAEESKETLKVLMPAMVEANVYYAAETLTKVLRERGALELGEIITATLNPDQTTRLLPAMCRVNPTWREDGFFDLMTEVLSTGGILRWEPSDVAKVIADLPKVPISNDYYTSPEFDPALPENEDKTPVELLQAAQNQAFKTQQSRWDHASYGEPGDFLLTPSKDDIEAAKREYEAVVNGTEDVDATAEAVGNRTENEIPMTNSEQVKRDEDSLLDYLDVSHSVASSPSQEVTLASEFEPAYYNPIAWQPEEVGRLIGTMLSQELELDDIVDVLSGLALDGWKDSASGAPWYAYMGYFSTVVSDALATNKHWVDEDYTWVLHDVITNVGPWALRQWPDYRTEEHQKWLADLVAQTAIKYGRFKHDYRLIQVMLNMLCDSWPDHEHQKLADMIEARMKDRTYVGRIDNWFKWRVSGRLKERFSDQRAAQSKLWIAPYNVGDNPKLPELVKSQGLRDPNWLEKITRNMTETEETKLTAPSRKGTKPRNTVNW
jgi:hypothetical protein